MRAKNREINIFNMSMLDVLTGALGAFMFMMLSFVPYYNIVQEQKLQENKDNIEKIDKDKLEDLKKQKDRANELEEMVKKLEQEKAELQKKIDELIEKLKKAGKGDITAEELAKLEEEINRLKKELAALQEKFDRLFSYAAKLLTENDQLKAEIEELKRQIAELKEKLKQLKPQDPRLEAELRLAQLEIQARQTSFRISAEVTGDLDFEFLIRDPKGFWYGARSEFILGRKAARVYARNGHAIIDEKYNLAGTDGRMLFVEVDGLVMPGEYLIGVRRQGGLIELPGTSPPPPPVSPAPVPPGDDSSSPSDWRKARRGLKWDNPFFFGISPDPYYRALWLPMPGFDEPHRWPDRFQNQPTKSPSPVSWNFPWEPGDAVAQTTDKSFGRGASVRTSESPTVTPAVEPPPAWGPMTYETIKGYIELRYVQRRNVERIPEQKIFANGQISVLAKLMVSEGFPKPTYALNFHWYTPHAWVTQGKADGFYPESERTELEQKVNSTALKPLQNPFWCPPGPGCSDDLRGEITQADLLPQYTMLAADQKTVQSPPEPPTPVPTVAAPAPQARTVTRAEADRLRALAAERQKAVQDEMKRRIGQ